MAGLATIKCEWAKFRPRDARRRRSCIRPASNHQPRRKSRWASPRHAESGLSNAAAKAGDSGGAGAIVIALPGTTIYRVTRNGVMLGGAIEGAKHWQGEELN
jgi:hypothetical protein